MIIHNKVTIRDLDIGGHLIGEGRPVFIVAEAGINHNGSEETALRIMEAAARCGADAIKFQSFRTERLLAPDIGAPIHVRGFAQQTMFEFFKSVELGEKAHRHLKCHADSLGLTFLSTVFDTEMADLLEDLNVPAFKIASGDITHFPLLRHVAAKGLPVLLSTGASHQEEVSIAVECLRQSGTSSVALLHCVSAYPAQPDELNLRSIKTLQEAFHLPVGFSDHTEDSLYALAAVAAGACILERHFTLDRRMPGPDQALSMDPDGFRRTVEQIRLLQAALGDGIKRPTTGEIESRRLGRRSVVAGVALHQGQVLDLPLLKMLRPGGGISPQEIDKMLGRRLIRDVSQNQALQWADLE
jgi:N,N'-diacetyllegionaminate synthase